MTQRPVAILGGGIQGVCAALALAQQGIGSTVFEASTRMLDRASGRGEGKIHLGFVYANDPTGATADLMLEAAMQFGPLLETWVGALDWDAYRSTPFAYASLPGSLLSDDVLRAHYERLDEAYRTTFRGSGLHYAGRVPDSLLHPRSPVSTPGWPQVGHVIAETAEVAVSRPAFLDRLRTAVRAHPLIEVQTETRVEAIEQRAGGFRLETVRDRERADVEASTVVNCTWADRLRLDRTFGREPDRPWVYRLKFRVLGRLSNVRSRPSITFVLGPFGDVVTYPDDEIYLSWYPTCLRGWSEDVAPPTSWGPACDGRTPPAEAADVVASMFREFGEIVPSIRGTAVDDVGAGVIFSWGTEDIDRPQSELHQRAEVGVAGGDGYFTINTGKFTCAPLFAHRLVTRVVADGVLA